jgi:hypothetical protein
MAKATIKNLPVDVKAKLSETVKKQLVEILHQEFHNQTTNLDEERRNARTEFLDKAKQKASFEKLKSAYIKKKAKYDAEVEEMERTIRDTGFDIDGNIANLHSGWYRGGKELSTREKAQDQRVRELSEALEKAMEAFNGPRAMLSKLQTRLLLASTVGEAMVIMEEVMGNELLPSMDLKQLTEK